MSDQATLVNEGHEVDQNWDPNEHYKDIAIAEEYDRVRFSSLAGRVFNTLEKRCIVRAFRTVPKSALILDMPCGTGRLAEALLEAGYRVFGADISPAMLEVARRKLVRFGERFETRVIDAREPPKDGVEFDAALCARVLMHFPLDEQIAFLKGVVALTRGPVIFMQSLSSPYHRARRGLKKIIGHQPPARFPITNAEIRELLASTSLREVARYRVLSPVSEAVAVLAEPDAKVG